MRKKDEPWKGHFVARSKEQTFNVLHISKQRAKCESTVTSGFGPFWFWNGIPISKILRVWKAAYYNGNGTLVYAYLPVIYGASCYNKVVINPSEFFSRD